MMERVALSAGRCGSECVEYSGSGVTRVDTTDGYSKRDKSIVYFVVNRY